MIKPGKPYNGGKIVVIGGSAGSIPVINSILCGLSKDFEIPVVLCLHRMKNVATGMCEVFSKICRFTILEPDDKQRICRGEIYLAPSNYHLLIENDFRFSLSTEELVNYSRPSIDITFQSAANSLGKNLAGILLTGANADGARGIQAIKEAGGTTIVQDPAECAVPFMANAALATKCVDQSLSVAGIIAFMNQL